MPTVNWAPCSTETGHVRPLPTVPNAYRLAAIVTAAVDSNGEITHPHYPEHTGDDAVAIHREWLTEWLDGSGVE